MQESVGNAGRFDKIRFQKGFILRRVLVLLFPAARFRSNI